MLFLCFSVLDRLPLINNFNQFIGNFGIETWYDRRNIFLGDKRHEVNITKGAKSDAVDYAVIFYSDNFKNGNICLDEYDILVERYKRKEIHLFPVFIGNAPQKIEDRFSLFKELVYKEIKSEEDFLRLSLHIVAKITEDKLQGSSIKTIQEYLNVADPERLIFELLRDYENINKNNMSMRIGVLFNIFKTITFQQSCEYFYKKTMNYLFYSNCYMDYTYEEKRELQIMENIVILESLRLFPIPKN
ncbi:TPA: toll/interleukin-1 receptor domain-containing protein [Candidatus Scatousia excrementigallinarum]|uniref:Toll/interleukin-1 receptor domain-containing protein n=1 Tax=Candidatus Scatousia excrementigallinarum TaxID=2840935 RepID=A0A9D1EYR3_9BACT|nr:toll/interleukin-1 receptor domain-containing protein [Candidatus Scatousia excrementigallinarum]